MKATYIGTCAEPGYGTVGQAAPATGHYDAKSLEEGAYVFQPDGSEYAYYVDPATDLAFA